MDVVHVTSPNQLHVPQVKAILAAGRHVVCEKPLAMTRGRSRAELVALAAASGRVAAVNFNIRFYPLNQHARELVAATAAWATSRLVTGHYFQDWLLMDTDWNWRLVPEQGGALRAVGDIGSHWIDLAGFITGRARQRCWPTWPRSSTSRQQPTRAGGDVLRGARRGHGGARR